MKRLIILTVFLLFFPIYGQAEEGNGQELVPSQLSDETLKVDIDKDGIDEEISLVSSGYEDNDKEVYIIVVKDDDRLDKTTAIEVECCRYFNLSTLEICPTLEPYIAVGYSRHGWKSYSLDLFRYGKSEMMDRTYFLKRIAHFESDIGSILLKDVDGDDIKEIVVRGADEDIIYKYVDNDEWVKIENYD